MLCTNGSQSPDKCVLLKFKNSSIKIYLVEVHSFIFFLFNRGKETLSERLIHPSLYQLIKKKISGGED